MRFKTLLACSLAAAQLLAAPAFATAKSHYVHRGRVVYHLPGGRCRTRTIADWRADRAVLADKVPAVFLWLAG